MKYLLISICLFLVCFLFSCNKIEFEEQTPQLVIDGYIDDGEFPVVIVTTSVTITQEAQKLEELNSHLLRWATVSVSDGNQKVFLTGKIDKSYFPPFIYTTSKMRGISGKTYTLNVDYENYSATAITTIPPKPQIDSIKIEPTETDSLCKIYICFTDNPNNKDYYKAFIKKGVYSKQWLSSYMGVYNDDILNGYSEIAINNGNLLTDTTTFSPFFNYSDTVSIKFANIDVRSYNYWYDFEKYTSLSKNPLFPITQNLRSNIIGGIGCWYGCGSETFYIPLCDYKQTISSTNQ